VQERILNPLSMRLLDRDFKPGDKIKVSANDGEPDFKGNDLQIANASSALAWARTARIR